MTDQNSEQQGQGAPSERGSASLRGMPSLRGAGSRLGRPAAAPSNASMVPSRSSYASASGSTPAGPRMQFRPVIPQRRKPSASPAPQPAPESSSTTSAPGISSRGGSSGRGRGGARPPRQAAQMTASGPFALGPSSRTTTSRARVVPLGPGPSTNTGAAADASSSKIDSDRASYRNPDKLKDTEEYSDPEDGGVSIIDMDQVHCLDSLAPIALPRVAEKTSKKDRLAAASARQKRMANRVKSDTGAGGVVQIKEDPDADSGSAMPMKEDDDKKSTFVSSESPPVSRDDNLNTADALDLSESEGEELMDDLVDDFVFRDDDGDNQVAQENRLYLFQFPQMFPEFHRPTKVATEETTEASSTATDGSKKRTVSFAEGTAGGAGLGGSAGVKEEIDSDNDGVPSEDDKFKVKPHDQHLEGQIGRLDVYRDGRVFFRFGELVMEVTGGSQSTFLQQVMLLNKKEATATSLGELHRKFIVSPELDCMLNDITIHDEEQRVLAQKLKRENEEKELAEKRSRFGGVAGAPVVLD